MQTEIIHIVDSLSSCTVTVFQNNPRRAYYWRQNTDNAETDPDIVGADS